jgi:hypothetical protein
MPNENNGSGITLNSITMSRLRNFAERAKHRGDERSLEAWTEELMDFGITELQRRWVSSDKYHNRNRFASEIAKLGVFDANGNIKDPALLAKLANKYQIVTGAQKEV